MDRNGLEIAIVGMAGRFPGASNIQEYWKNLCHGNESISFFTKDELLKKGIKPEIIHNERFIPANGVIKDRECFDASFFGYTDSEAKVMDPQSRILHEVVWEAIEDSGCIPGVYEGAIGLFAGAGSSLKWEAGTFLSGNDSTLGKYSTSILASRDFMCTKISYKLNLKGPSLFIQTACSTSLVAIHEASRAILTGECQMALAGGVTIGFDSRDGYLYEEGMIYSRDGHCKPFDKDASGTVPSEGACIVALKSLEDAIKDHNSIYAVIKGTAINNDGQHKVGYTSPSVQGQESVIKTAHNVAEIDPDRISYIETHGTGTSLGDMVEVEALKRVFNASSKGSVVIGSVKSNIGHLDCAAGAAGLIKSVMMLQHGLIPPTCHFQNENPRLNLLNSPFTVNKELIPWESQTGIRYAGVSSFGIGGTNAHAVLEEYKEQKRLEDYDENDELLILSAHSDGALQQMKNNIQNYIIQNPQARMKDISYTLQTGRKAYPLRTYAVISGKGPRTITFNDVKDGSLNTKLDERPVVFMLHEVDDTIAPIVRSLYQCEPIFKKIANNCINVVINSTESNRLATEDNLPKLDLLTKKRWLMVYCYAKYLMESGVIPSCLSASGCGFLVGLCLSGIIAMQDMVKMLNQLDTEDLETSTLLDQLKQVKLQGDLQSIPIVSPITGQWWKKEELNWEIIYNSCLINYHKVETQSLQMLLSELDSPILISTSQSEHSIQATIDASNADFLHICDKKHLSFLNLLGEIWRLCGKIDWKTFNERRIVDCYILHLPSYPFEKTTYPFEYASYKKQVQDNQEIKSTTKKSDITPDSSQLYIPGWKATRRLRGKMGNMQKQTHVVFSNHTSICDRLCNSLEQGSHQVIHVYKGENYVRTHPSCFYINPSSAKDFNRLIQELKSESVEINSFVFAWCLSNDREERFISSEMVTEALKMGFFSIKNLAGALKDIKQDIRITYLTNNMQKVQGDKVFFPELSTVLGMIQVLPEEDKKFNCKSIDISWSDKNDPFLLDLIREEIEFYSEDHVVCLRGNERLIPHYHSFEQNESTDPPFIDGGIYLIIGGLGALGLETCKYIVNNSKNPRLLLVQRTPIPSLEERETNEDSQTYQVLQTINYLKQNGAYVETVSADVSDAESMSILFSKISKQFGKINGLIHCGGIAKGGFIEKLQLDDFMEQFSAKVFGMINLELFITEAKPDFVLLYSSVNAYQSTAGTSGYTAANCFLDAYASYRSNMSRTQVCSINWPAWKQAGMALKNINNLKKHYIYPNFYEKRNLVECRQYFTMLSGKAHWMLNEHKVNEIAVMPGTAYVNLIGMIIEKFYYNDKFTINGMDIINPLYVMRDESVEVIVTITNENKFEIKSKNEIQNNWVVNVKGNLNFGIVGKPRIPFKRITIKEPTGQDSILLKNYNSIQFGPRWINNILGYDMEQNAIHLKLPAEFHKDLKSNSLHPALMDAAMMIFPESDNKLYMPFHYDSITVYRSLPAEIISFIKVSERNKDMISYDYSIYTMDGSPVLDILGYTLVEVKEKKSSIDDFIEPESDTSDLVPDEFFDNGISNEEGTEMLARIINSGLSRFVVGHVTLRTDNKNKGILLLEDSTKRLNSNSHSVNSLKHNKSLTEKRDFNATKLELKSIWGDLLGITDVDEYANYFDDLGATSMNVIQANENIFKRLNKEVSITEFYNHPTIHNFAIFLAGPNEAERLVQKEETSSRKKSNLMKRKQRLEGHLTSKE
ncbi:SDR family NAD(P)-dependent oxidoreductase [Paenibacillus aquistagni]|uniref:SDR family NAD(P)-dependent oxidoreductase n=1 Tax=Paenibacillus aquistagni TaxID=1852522 RepID=UPI00145A98CF|nr:SDR family NAD(P)-dependent oxidoreductase [Paenibacillus aquistagni]NMM55487.1 SDR family NAD(P)-dependent oxidoreductase [Paenibacillus aquistagni]